MATATKNVIQSVDNSTAIDFSLAHMPFNTGEYKSAQAGSQGALFVAIVLKYIRIFTADLYNILGEGDATKELKINKMLKRLG